MAAFNQSVCIIIAVIKLFIAIKCFGSWVSCYVNMAMAASNHEKFENILHHSHWKKRYGITCTCCTDSASGH